MSGCSIMFNNTAFRIVCLGGLATMCVLTWTIWGTIAGTIVLILMVDQVFFNGGLSKNIRRKFMLREIARLRHHPDVHNIEDIKYTCTINTSPKIQYIRFSLRMKRELTLLFICLVFMGDGKPPIIEDVYDWYKGHGFKPKDVSVDRVIDGNWYWTFTPPSKRFKGSNTTIGIDCIATEPFDGVLEFQVTTNEIARKFVGIPFKVEVSRAVANEATTKNE